MKWCLIIIVFICIHINQAKAQVIAADSIVKNNELPDTPENSKYLDSIRHRRIRRTILRSTFVPGWGQVTNKQFWKVPLVAAAVGLPVAVFFSNLSEYRGLRQSYIYKVDNDPSNDALIPERYQPLSANSIKFYRDAFRQNVDYSALVFILGWGLNVVDAAVFANLKDFDVSDKLSLKINQGINPLGQSSVGLVLTFKSSKKQPFFTN